MRTVLKLVRTGPSRHTTMAHVRLSAPRSTLVWESVTCGVVSDGDVPASGGYGGSEGTLVWHLMSWCPAAYDAGIILVWGYLACGCKG